LQPGYRSVVNTENMAEKELNLFQFPAMDMAEFCAGSPKIVWSEMVQLHPLSAPSNDVPNDILGDPLTPRRPMAAHRAKNRPAATFAKSLHRLLA
jgi:hypothetical protein